MGGKRRRNIKNRTTSIQIFISITLNVKSKTVISALSLEFRAGLSNLRVAFSETCLRMEGIPVKLHMNENVNVTKKNNLCAGCIISNDLLHTQQHWNLANFGLRSLIASSSKEGLFCRHLTGLKST